MHSLNVSYISWLIARKLGWDAQTAARAGLLHDFCVYDFKDKLPKGEIQAYYHPRVAASTSERHFLISDKERQAILSHMFPLGPLPESREAWLISLADKLCAISGNRMMHALQIFYCPKQQNVRNTFDLKVFRTFLFMTIECSQSVHSIVFLLTASPER